MLCQRQRQAHGPRYDVPSVRLHAHPSIWGYGVERGVQIVLVERMSRIQTLFDGCTRDTNGKMVQGRTCPVIASEIKSGLISDSSGLLCDLRGPLLETLNISPHHPTFYVPILQHRLTIVRVSVLTTSVHSEFS